MKILLTEKYPEIKQEYLDYLNKNNEVINILDDYNNSEIDTIIIRSSIKVDLELLDKYRNLKFVARVGIGLDKVDLEECKNRDIKVLNTPGANADSVADLALAGILNLSRNLTSLQPSPLRGEGVRFIENRFDYMGSEFSSKSVGIIGFGNIGKKIYTRLKAFGVKSFYIFDPFLKKEDVEQNEFCKFIETKEEIFEHSDIISFHIPLLDSTKDFLGKVEIKLLKKDVILVNTSRGGIINEKVLVHFLKENPDSRFFADVWEEEPNDPKIELLELENVLITPHIGAMTKQAEEKMHFF
ncbi:MAG: NAD(P)-dependent oxidoreductase [Candidatus Gracilibacteria bacterium]|nr:NAD(P)-dependent oxidoreductase [Candidatus Gracilibacteria bacterium]